ncbi:MAG: endonuclease, partial [Clostridia bacterium]|nr:endonuclease [Clostridia bacterium]
VHMGWWNDVEEPFCEQWERLKKHISVKERVWLMGDFNSRADVRNEGYDLVTNDGFYDTYLLAAEKDSGITARGSIDGWSESGLNKARIDYILCSEKINVKSTRVIFNNQNYRAISDHYGLEIIL